MLRQFSVLLSLCTVDQGLKYWVTENLGFYQRYPVINGEEHPWLVLSRVKNLGIIGFRFSNPEEPTLSFYVSTVVPTVIFSALLLWAMASWSRMTNLMQWGMGLLLSGGASNLLGNWQGRGVVDSLQIYYGNGYFLPFNVADPMVVLGGVLVLVECFRLQFRVSETQVDSSRSPELLKA